MTRNILAAAAIAVLLIGSVSVGKLHAQTRSTSAFGSSTGSSLGSSMGSYGSSSGLGSSSSFGSSSGFGTSSGSSFGQSAFGQSGTGQSGFGQSGFGQSSLGQNGMMGGLQSGYGGLSGTQGYGALGGQTGFGSTSQFGQSGRLGQSSLSGLNSNMGRTGQLGGRTGTNGRTTSQTVRNTQPQIPVKLQVAFSLPHVDSSALASNVQTDLQKVIAAGKLGGSSQVAIDGNVTVLKGTAPTENQRQLMERIVSLQPGVGAIRNEIVVASDEGSNQ